MKNKKNTKERKKHEKNKSKFFKTHQNPNGGVSWVSSK
jgi:hypothetical protein